jgi:hypothetical protein
MAVDAVRIDTKKLSCSQYLMSVHFHPNQFGSQRFYHQDGRLACTKLQAVPHSPIYPSWGSWSTQTQSSARPSPPCTAPGAAAPPGRHSTAGNLTRGSRSGASFPQAPLPSRRSALLLSKKPPPLPPVFEETKLDSLSVRLVRVKLSTQHCTPTCFSVFKSPRRTVFLSFTRGPRTPLQNPPCKARLTSTYFSSGTHSGKKSNPKRGAVIRTKLNCDMAASTRAAMSGCSLSCALRSRYCAISDREYCSSHEVHHRTVQ